MTVKSGLIKLLALITLTASLATPEVCRAQSGGTVFEWGNTINGETNVLPTLTNVVSVAAGSGSCMALKSDGTVVAWGNNLTGVTNVPVGLTNVVQIAAGQSNSLALCADGTVVKWGNSSGQLSIPPNLTNVISICCGQFHNLALKSDGTVLGWGLGNSTITNPPAGLTNVTAIAAGSDFSLALNADGTVTAWGRGSLGSTNVSAAATNVIQVAAGNSFGLALRGDGAVIGWGNILVPAAATNIVAISANPIQNTCLAIKSDKTILTWNGGAGGPTNQSNFAAVAAGNNIYLAIQSTNAPCIYQQPTNLTVFSATPALFRARALSTAPTVYQWQLNGTNIPGATNIILTLPSAQLSDTGNYTISVSDSFGVTVSSNATLTVVTSPPVIVNQPTNVAVPVGTNAVTVKFYASVVGSLPISYQWQFNGSSIPGATNSTLTLSSVQSANQGLYSVVATNAFGSTQSSNALLSVQTLADLGSVLDATNLVWLSTSSPPYIIRWFGQTNITHDGVAAAQTGPAPESGESILQTTVVGPGTLSFWWRVSVTPQGPFGSYLGFFGAGNYYTTINGNTAWQQFTYYVPAGNQVLEWNFLPGSVGTGFTNAGWVDQVSYVPGATPPGIVSGPTNQAVNAGSGAAFVVAANGTPPFAYQWQFNSANILGATNSYVVINDAQTTNQGSYSVIVDNGYGPATNATAALTVTPSTPKITSQPVSAWTVQGGFAYFSGAANGTEPLAYQWLLKGVGIPGATGTLLSLTNVQPSNAGVYQMVVSNALGSTLSSNANLTLGPSAVVAWGANNFGDTTVPAGLTNAMAVAAGMDHSLVLHDDGTVTAWGDNYFGQISVPANLTNVSAIACGDSHTLAVQSNGTVVAWGRNDSGQCNVPIYLVNAIAVAGGSSFSLALKSNGSVLGWGDNSSGQTNVPVALTGVQAISANSAFALALQSNGLVVAWGSNQSGQTNVPPGLSNVVAIAAGYSHCLALRRDGTVAGWGSDYYGETDIPPGLTNVVAITAGWSYSIALKNDGTLAGWGTGNYGVKRGLPGMGDLDSITGGFDHALAILATIQPTLNWQPQNLTVNTGQTIQLSVGAIGSQPLAFQWQFNGANLAGATGGWWSLTNATFGSAGSYQCIITNSYGSITSAPAIVTVNRSIPVFNTVASHWTPVGFSFEVDNLSGHGPVIIFSSPSLLNWTPVLTNPPVLGSFQFTDPAAGTNLPSGFYRAVEQ